MKNPLVFLFWMIVIGGFINYFLTLSPVTEQTKEQIKEAFMQYMKGEKATTLAERTESFNQALKLYTTFETQYNPTFGDGVLYYNIGNTYFQLREYPWAVLYYHRALKLMPKNEKIEHNLQVALEKLNIKETNDASIFRKILVFYHYFSLPQRLEGLFYSSLGALIFASLYIWHQKNWMKPPALFFSIAVLIFLISLSYTLYVEPSEGVLVQSTALYRDAGFQYAKVKEEPILSGNKVQIVDVLDQGHWLKVMTPEGSLGYVPSESIRMI